MDLSISEALSYSTVRIECEYKNGDKGTGTGFFFKILNDEAAGRYVPVVITNKHVIKNSTWGKLIITKADEDHNPLDTEHFQAYIENFESCWRNHPDNDVDLCAMPIAELRRAADKMGEKLFYIPLDKSVLPSQQQLTEFSALEEILMIGYPDDIWDKVNNKPIFRRGITAIHPKFDYCGKKETMIDMACFPGSSGSPVFIFNEAGYNDKFGNINLGTTRVILLGVLYAGPQHTVKGEIKIENVPTSFRPLVISKIPNNLGLIIKSERIGELENLFK